ncbi:MAG TPA: metallophosphoesterase [Methylocystis sp.]|nr:metallophosphoesterase [Methylocystis sp.]
MISRREFLRLAGGSTLLGFASLFYGVIGEPLLGLRVKSYALTPPNWPKSLRLRLAVIADPHACEPWMTPDHLQTIVDVANDLGADCALLLGDYVATHHFQRPTPPKLWAGALGRLRAPLGVHAILGNHDWWADRSAMRYEGREPFGALALRDAGVAVHRNQAVRLLKDGQPFWLVGLDDQIAFTPVLGKWRDREGAHDIVGAFAQVTDDAPVILLAHEPDIFPNVPQRVALTLCGHMHGGQCNLLGWTPFVPEQYDGRSIYGLSEERGRHMIISGGLGCSVVPARIGAPPEIVLVELGEPAVA